MNYSEADIQILDSIIYRLSSDHLATVPEILYGYQNFPRANSQDDLNCRHYEDVLVNNKICYIQDGWTANSVPHGFKLLILDSAGRDVVRTKKSIRNFFLHKEKEKKLPVMNINTIHGGHAIIGDGNSGINQGHNFEILPQIQPINSPNQNANQSKVHKVEIATAQFIFWLFSAFATGIGIGFAIANYLHK